jgi:hypothetical protein
LEKGRAGEPGWLLEGLLFVIEEELQLVSDPAH